MQRITPFLWFDDKAEEAMNFYGGEKSRCGWLKDKYGLSWQVVPTVFSKLLQDKDAEKSKRVMNAMLQMDKIDIDALKQAHAG